MSTSSLMETPEARELSLVGKVELRIALTDSDSKLESVLKTYLPPLLLKLSSQHISVRNKVISICQHINTRIKPPSIKLPVAALLKQYKENLNMLIRHFDILFIDQGLNRLSKNERLDLLPTLVRGLGTNYEESAAHAASIFNVLLQILHSFSLPVRGSEDDVALRARLGLSDRPEDAEFVASWLGKLILFSASNGEVKRCPGLNTEECSFLQLHGKKATWAPISTGGMNLVETKVLAAKFLASGAFTDTERFFPALFASADPNSRLSEVGDDILKRAYSSVSLEPKIIEKLFEIYLGTRGTEGSLPARIPLQIKILTLLCKSRLSSSYIQQSVQIINEGLLPPGSEQSNTPLKDGLEISKLRVQVFAFTNWLTKTSSSTEIRAFAPNLVVQLRGYIESQGWPVVKSGSSHPRLGELGSRGYCYESIGLLAASCPDTLLFDADLDLLRWLFISLSTDASGNEISMSIEQALSSALGAFGQETNSRLQGSLSNLLLYHMGLRPGKDDLSNFTIIRSTRFLAVRFANRCLPYSNVTARWINILAMSKEPNDRVEEEGRKGLDPYWHKISIPPKRKSLTDAGPTNGSHYQFPSFSKLVKRFFGPGAEWDVRKLENNQIQSISAYSSAITFCHHVLMHHALLATEKSPLPDLDSDWHRNIDALIANDEDSRAGIRTYLGHMFIGKDNDREALETYMTASFNGIINPNNKGSDQSGECLLEIFILGPDKLLNNFTGKVLSLEDSILANQKSTREIAAHVFGLLASRKECPELTVQKILTSFDQKARTWSQAIGSEVSKVHGSMLAIAYFLSRGSYRGNKYENHDELQANFFNLILDVLTGSRDKELLDAATVAISQFSLFSTLSPNTIMQPSGFSTLLQKLGEKCKLGDEKAILALGHIAMQCEETEAEDSHLDKIITTLYSLHESREPLVHFAVGESISCAAIGWHSKSLMSSLDLDGGAPRTPARKNVLSEVLDKILSNCRATKPALRQASVIWLLCLVQYCGHLEEVQHRLRDCQSAFRGFLADRESLNQESASRGLMLVYEKGNRSIKDDLIRDLVGSFTGTSANLAGNVSSDTELFEPNYLRTGEGSVTTYKDIMSLASEVGNPELVYQFMSLASNNAIWTSRAALGRFGLSDILRDSSVDGYLAENPKLYPALFRYRFDPNTNVRNSMNDIWNALVKDPASMIDLYFSNIMDDLLKNILGKEWRVRQASCAAIADLLQGRPIEKYEGYLSQIWAKTFKVCDDIKASVRSAAMSLAKVLTGILTRSLEATNSSSSKADSMLEQVVPFLLSPSGLESSAQDVQAFALYSLLEIIKSSSNQTLRPFIPNLVGHLLALLSSLEPGAVNYIRLNADQYDITTEQIDDIRLNGVRSSPMMEAIERCLDFLDERTMAALSPSLENTIKTAIGLPSKVGSTRVLVALATRHNFVFKNYADQFLRLSCKQLLDRNDTVSSAFAAACGYLARLASEEGILKLVEYCRQLYFESDDDRHRTVSGELVYAISKRATDRFNSIASAVLPFVFVAKHDSLESTKSFFQDTWNENVGGSRAVLLYLKDVIDLSMNYLESPRWSVKQTSALAISDTVNSSGSEMTQPNAKLIWPAIEKAVGGRAWEGKEMVLHSLVQLFKSSQILASDASVAKKIETIVVRESKRSNPSYRRHALACLGDFAEQVNLFAQVYTITKPIITDILSDSHEMDIDSPSGGPSSKSITDATLANSIVALLKSINPKLQSDASLASSLTQTVELSTQILSVGGNTTAQLATYTAYESLFKRLALDERSSLFLENVLIRYVQTLFSVEDRIEQVRVRAADASIALAAQVRSNKLTLALGDAIINARKNERSATVLQSLDRAQKQLEI